MTATAHEDPVAYIEAVLAPASPLPPPRQRTTAAPSADQDLHPYVARALADEVQTFTDAPKGSRNEQLNKAAFSLGQLVAGGVLKEAAVWTALQAASDASGYTADDGQATVDSSIRSGLSGSKQHPRAIPPKLDTDGWLNSHATSGQADTHSDTAADGSEDPAAALSALVRKNLPTLDWHTLWADQSEEEWIVEPILPARRLVALYSAPKVGKSLLLLELCCAIATGRPVLGSTVDRARRVLYVDFENDPRADIRERLQSMGYGPDDLSNLHYLSFPTLAGLDSPRGGQELMAAVNEYQCEVVVIDTISRAIAGEENENDTWLHFYRHTGLLMKQAGVALIRLDHSGKDESKGQRGGSAKSGDVDAVWRLSRITDDTFRLDCEAARMPITEKTLVLHRETGPLRHRVDAEGWIGANKSALDAAEAALNQAQVPASAGRPTVAKAVKAAGIKLGTKGLTELVRRRQARSAVLVPALGDSTSGQAPVPGCGDSAGTGGTAHE